VEHSVRLALVPSSPLAPRSESSRATLAHFAAAQHPPRPLPRATPEAGAEPA
jgi:hypothetical protein